MRRTPDKRQARGGARLERTRITPLELDSKTNASVVTGSGHKSGGIEIGLRVLTKLRCKQHDGQHLSRLVPSGLFESLSGLASTTHAASLGTYPAAL